VDVLCHVASSNQMMITNVHLLTDAAVSSTEFIISHIQQPLQANGSISYLVVKNNAPLTDTELALNLAFLSTIKFTFDHIRELLSSLDSIKSRLKPVKGQKLPCSCLATQSQ
jgi:hypothetical protein